MRFSGVFQSASFTVRKRFVNAFLPSPYTVSKPSKNAPKTAKKIRNACGKNPHPLPPSCGSQSPKNRFVRPFFGILQVLAPKTPARWPFSHSLCVFTRWKRRPRQAGPACWCACARRAMAPRAEAGRALSPGPRFAPCGKTKKPPRPGRQFAGHVPLRVCV